MSRATRSPRSMSVDTRDLWSSGTAATPFDNITFDDLTRPQQQQQLLQQQQLFAAYSPKVAAAGNCNPFDDFVALNPPTPKRMDANIISPRRNSFQITQHQGLRGHLQQPPNTMYTAPPPAQQHVFNFDSTPGFPTSQPAAVFDSTASEGAAFDPFNPAAATAFPSTSSQHQRRDSDAQKRLSGSHRRGSESHRLSEEIAFDPFALDALSSAVPVEEVEEVKESDHEAADAEELSSHGRLSEQDDDAPSQDVHTLLSMREQQLVVGERFTVLYPSKTRLGLLLERRDEWIQGCAKRSERAVVRMVVAGTESEIRGVTSGSKVVAVNGQSMLSVPYTEVLETVRRASRPISIEFERAPPVQPNDEVAGNGFFRISRSPYAPSSMAEWEPMYFVIGGAIAKPHILQVYANKDEFENTVVALFRKEKITTRVQVFKLDMQCKLSVIKEKRYGGEVIRFFSLKPGNYKFKSIKIGATRDFEQLRKLHAHMSRFTTAA